jgi:hypothetical protein
LVVSVTVFDEFSIPLLNPFDDSLTRSTLQLTLDAKPLNDNMLIVDSTDSSVGETELFRSCVIEKSSWVFSDFLPNGREPLSVASWSAVH